MRYAFAALGLLLGLATLATAQTEVPGYTTAIPNSDQSGVIVSQSKTQRVGNFIVTAYDPVVAYQLAEAADAWCQRHYKEWAGLDEAPSWKFPAEIDVHVDIVQNSHTNYTLYDGELWTPSGDWYGDREELVNSTIPHEVLHLVLADLVGKPLPRWVDEGLCSIVESEQERVVRHDQLVMSLLKRPVATIDFTSQRKASMTQLVRAAEVNPSWLNQFYNQSMSQMAYISATKLTKPELVTWLQRGASLADLGYAGDDKQQDRAFQNDWLAWIQRGSPGLLAAENEQIVAFQCGSCSGGSCNSGGFNTFAPAIVRSVLPQRFQPQRVAQVPAGGWNPANTRSTATFREPALSPGSSIPSTTPVNSQVMERIAGIERDIKDLKTAFDNFPTSKDGKDGKDGVDGVVDYNLVRDQIEEALRNQPPPVFNIDEIVVKLTEKIKTDPELIAVLKGKDGQDGKDGVDGKDGKDGKDGQDAETPTIPELPGTFRHLVLVADTDADTWYRLSDLVERAQSHYHRITVVAPPTDADIGTIPKLVEYEQRDGVSSPQQVHQGDREVERILSLIARGEYFPGAEKP